MKDRLGPQLSNEILPFEPQFFRNVGSVVKTQSYVQKQIIFPQDDPAAALFYVREGQVKLTVFSSGGKAATIAILDKGDFLGEECLVPGHALRPASAVAITDCCLLKIGRDQMLAALESDRFFAASFTQYLLRRKIHAEENLADQIFHSSEKRLVRLLLLLAGPETDSGSKRRLPDISQEVLAEMVGTTRPRISYFMTKFRKLGLIDYSRGLRVRKDLQDILR